MVDGQAAMANPNDEFGRLIDFFGLTSKSIHFEFNESKGFHCLNKPVNYCLGDGKGTSRKEHVDLFRRVLESMSASKCGIRVYSKTHKSKYPKLIHLKKAYKNQMLKLFQYVHDCNGEVDCCSLKVQRFNWCQDYFCT